MSVEEFSMERIEVTVRALRAPVRPDSGLGASTTVSEGLRVLLKALWLEGAEFSVKRPFGNSGWEWDIYEGLIREGLIDGKFDEDGYIDSLTTKDRIKADRIIEDCIDLLFGHFKVPKTPLYDEEHLTVGYDGE